MNLFVGGLRVLIEKRLGGENHAVQTVAALRGLLLDERFLNRMWLFRTAEPFERDNLGAVHGADRRAAAAHGAAVHDRSTRTALSETAAEFRSFQRQIVAEDVQQRGGRVDVHGVGLPVYFQSENTHCGDSRAPGQTDANACRGGPFGPSALSTVEADL